MAAAKSGLTAAKRAEILRACERLCLDYCYFADTDRHDEWGELFAEDGELHVFGQIHRGRKAIRASVGPRPETATLHVISNLRIDVVSDSEAAGAIYIALYAAPKQKGGVGVATEIEPVVMGMYEDVYRKTSKGWRFAKRAFRPFITKPAPQ